MKDYVARSMQISYLTREQIKRLHDLEDREFYAIPNWNIQELFFLPSIKVKYGLEKFDDQALALHAARIESELKQKFKGHFNGRESGLEWTHALDWSVHNRSNEIIWEGSSRGSYVSKVKESQPLEIID